MTAERLINALNKVPKEADIHIMLEGSDYGDVCGLIQKNGKVYACTAFELQKSVPKEIITGEPEEKAAPEKTDSGNKAKD